MTNQRNRISEARYKRQQTTITTLGILAIALLITAVMAIGVYQISDEPMVLNTELTK